MTGVSFVLVVMIGALALNVYAQEAARPTVDLTTKATEPNSAQTTPVPAPPELPELSQLDEIFKQTSLGKTADEFRLHLEWRRLRNQVANNADVMAAKKAAESAHTDLEKRERLRQYYGIYYAHMQALAKDPQVKSGLDAMQAAHLASLAQSRVRPSPSPAPSASPVPSPAEENEH